QHVLVELPWIGVVAPSSAPGIRSVRASWITHEVRPGAAWRERIGRRAARRLVPARYRPRVPWRYLCRRRYLYWRYLYWRYLYWRYLYWRRESRLPGGRQCCRLRGW